MCYYLRKRRRGAQLPPAESGDSVGVLWNFLPWYEERWLSDLVAWRLPQNVRRKLTDWAEKNPSCSGRVSVSMLGAVCDGRRRSAIWKWLSPRYRRVQLVCLRAPVGSPAPWERHCFQTWVIDELYVICKCECINLLNDSLIYVSL